MGLLGTTQLLITKYYVSLFTSSSMGLLGTTQLLITKYYVSPNRDVCRISMKAQES
jgi:hypothetical protein